MVTRKGKTNTDRRWRRWGTREATRGRPSPSRSTTKTALVSPKIHSPSITSKGWTQAFGVCTFLILVRLTVKCSVSLAGCPLLTAETLTQSCSPYQTLFLRSYRSLEMRSSNGNFDPTCGSPVNHHSISDDGTPASVGRPGKPRRYNVLGLQVIHVAKRSYLPSTTLRRPSAVFPFGPQMTL
ncbi:hypothetical protein LZ31DRAFT_151874 [Colletotrichum somersetense]|nr:hypothetical protein LZ31DRAFT_151874 [Colletotrichum somersetense]